MNKPEITMVLNAEDAAVALGLSTSTLAKLRLTGKGPFYAKIGRRVVYRNEDLTAFLNARTYHSTAEYLTPNFKVHRER